MPADSLFVPAEPKVFAPARLPGRTEWLGLVADDGLRTAAAERIVMTFEGPAGDRHAGFTRPAGSREPWYPRGSAMRNGRQVTVVSAEDLEAIRLAMDLPRFEAAWIGTTIVVSGIARFSFLPAGTRLVFEGGAVLVVEGQNAPCRYAGREIAAEFPEREGLDLLFPKVARRLRGVVASVEREGTIVPAAALEAKLPEQWIYG